MFKLSTIVLVLVLLPTVLAMPNFGFTNTIAKFFKRIWDSYEDNCYHAVRHRGNASPELAAKMMDWEIEGLQDGSNSQIDKDCKGDFDGCQTYSCLDDDGHQIFVLNSCAVPGSNCSLNELDSICGSERGNGNCQICYEGLCNKENIEIKVNNGTMVENGTGKAKMDHRNSTPNGNSAKTGVNSAKAEEGNAKMDGDNAKMYGDNAKMDEDNAKMYGDNAKMNEDNAKMDEDNAKMDGDNAKMDGDNAKMDEDNAKMDGDNAKMDEDNAKMDEDNAKMDEDNAKMDDDKARPEDFLTFIDDKDFSTSLEE